MKTFELYLPEIKSFTMNYKFNHIDKLLKFKFNDSGLDFEFKDSIFNENIELLCDELNMAIIKEVGKELNFLLMRCIFHIV